MVKEYGRHDVSSIHVSVRVVVFLNSIILS